ncbi:MAG: hypothetical protein R2798_14190 [Chitinophagales bacterium]|nr:hypothetical protein [Bacteroidota bacterium]MCB9043440.1 hypothetical protein [Chitinophagales bacterium]
MKELKLIIGLFFVIINLTVFGQAIENNDLDRWGALTEENYSINYPDDWELNQSGIMGTSFILFSPISSEKDQFRENVNLLIQNLTGLNLDLNKYVEISVDQIRTILTDGKIITNERITTENLDYQKAIYTGKQGIFDLTFEQYYWVVGDNAFVLTLTCETGEFDNYQTVGEKILNSFNIK